MGTIGTDTTESPQVFFTKNTTSMIRTKITPTDRNPSEHVILSRRLIDLFLAQPRPSDLISLFCLYSDAVSRQTIDSPSMVVQYAIDSFKWSRQRVLKAQKLLNDLGVLNDIIVLDDAISNDLTDNRSDLNKNNNKSDRQRAPARTGARDYFLSSKGGREITPAQVLRPPARSSVRTRVATDQTDEITPKRPNRMIPPTVEMVRAYCNDRQNDIDAESFIDFYASKGWMIGKNRMLDWQAAVRTWERNRKSTATAIATRGKPQFVFDTFGVRYKLCDDGRYRHPKNGSLYVP